MNVLPSSSLAITIPLPALAENTKPAFTRVNMANPLACSRTERGMTPSKPLFPLSTKASTESSDRETRSRVKAERCPLADFSGLYTFFWKALGQRVVQLHWSSKELGEFASCESNYARTRRDWRTLAGPGLCILLGLFLELANIWSFKSDSIA